MDYQVENGKEKWTAHKLVSCHGLQKYHSHYTEIIVYRVIKLSNCCSVATAHRVVCGSEKRLTEVDLGSALTKIINCEITC